MLKAFWLLVPVVVPQNRLYVYVLGYYCLVYECIWMTDRGSDRGSFPWFEIDLFLSGCI